MVENAKLTTIMILLKEKVKYFSIAGRIKLENKLRICSTEAFINCRNIRTWFA